MFVLSLLRCPFLPTAKRSPRSGGLRSARKSKIPLLQSDSECETKKLSFDEGPAGVEQACGGDVEGERADSLFGVIPLSLSLFHCLHGSIHLHILIWDSHVIVVSHSKFNQ